MIGRRGLAWNFRRTPLYTPAVMMIVGMRTRVVLPMTIDMNMRPSGVTRGAGLRCRHVGHRRCPEQQLCEHEQHQGGSHDPLI